MPVKLTKSVIEQLAPPSAGQAFQRDTDLKGFAIRLTPSGTKSFVLEKRIQGRLRRITLGRYGELTVAQARARAQHLAGQIAMGDDPIAQRRREKARAITLEEAYRDYLDAHPRLSKKTRADYDRAFNKVFADWRRRPLNTISRPMVLRRHQELAPERGEYGANNYMRALRSLFNFARQWYEDGAGEAVITRNPVLVLTQTRAWFPEERRRTIVKTHQLPAWYRAVEGLREQEHHRALGDTIADYLLFLVLTGLRRNEAATLKWRDVDLVERTFTVTQTKNRRPHTLPFHDFATDLLLRRQGARQNQYVFAGYQGQGPLIEQKRQVERVAAESGVPFTMHDLRRTFITVAESLEISPYAIKRLVNHSTRNDVTAGYIISDVERLREPMRQIEAYFVSAMQVERATYVVPGVRSTNGRPTQP